MRIKFTSFLFFIAYISLAQSKEFLILDSLSKKPIDLVQVFYPDIEVGSVSNADGKIKIPLKNNRIVVSHINYIESEFGFEDFKNKDTLLLTRKANQLDEIVLYNLDLKQKFIDILENGLSKKYSTKKVIRNATYKESFSVNDSLTRLFQVQLDWYSKNSLFKTDITIEKENKITLQSVDFSKIKEINKDFVDSNSGHVENKSFFKFLHLDFLLQYILVNSAKDYEIEVTEKNKNTINVYFNATCIQNGKNIFNLKNSLIVFDKDYKSIKSLKLDMVYNSNFKDATTKRTNKPYKIKMKSHTIELSFNKMKNNKYGISYSISQMNGVIKTKRYINDFRAKQSLFINESKLGEKIKKGNIDFNKPFYENIPSNLKKASEKILLTEKEKLFMKS